MPISYTSSNLREKQHINGWDHAQQVYKIWRQIFQELLSNHIFGVGSLWELRHSSTISNPRSLFIE